MPASVSHRTHAENVYEKIKDLTKRTVNKNAYLWGAQGPDFLLCSRILPWMKGESLAPFGHKVHGVPVYKILDLIKKDTELYSDDTVFSYGLGLVCHWAMDSYCHPFVGSQTKLFTGENPLYSGSCAHVEIESYIDAAVSERCLNKPVSKIKLVSCFPDDKDVYRAIVKLYLRISELTEESISENKFKEAISDTRKAHRVLTDPTGFKKNFFRIFEKGKAYYSVNFRPVKYERYKNFDFIGEESEEGFFARMKLAEEKAVSAISCFLSDEYIKSGDTELIKNVTDGRSF